jgi:hypothetical protein
MCTPGGQTTPELVAAKQGGSVWTASSKEGSLFLKTDYDSGFYVVFHLPQPFLNISCHPHVINSIEKQNPSVTLFHIHQHPR